jgi:hypothetical protein
MDRTPIILTGPPGSGKSHYIIQYAKSINKQLFVCPCRKDRTLRDGRQKLHIWARRTEPAILWLEGADDLTPEAQAFLRRILETHASEVTFILECRDAGKLQEPIRSRCNIKRFSMPRWDELDNYINTVMFKGIKNINRMEIKEYLLPKEYSYRRIKQCIHLQSEFPEIWKSIFDNRKNEKRIIEENDVHHEKLIEYIYNAYDPDTLIEPQLNDKMTLKDYGKCYEISGSKWAFLGSALYKNKPIKNTE